MNNAIYSHGLDAGVQSTPPPGVDPMGFIKAATDLLARSYAQLAFLSHAGCTCGELDTCPLHELIGEIDSFLTKNSFKGRAVGSQISSLDPPPAENSGAAPSFFRGMS